MSHDEEYDGTCVIGGEALQAGYSAVVNTFQDDKSDKQYERPFIGNRHHRRKMQVLIRKHK
jgi:hypothetical protein